MFIAWVITMSVLLIMTIVAAIAMEDTEMPMYLFFTIAGTITIIFCIVGLFRWDNTRIEKATETPKMEIVADSTIKIDSLSAYKIDLPEIILVK